MKLVGLMILTMLPWGYPDAAVAEQPAAPAPVAAGLQAYKAEGAEAAVKAWLKGSPVEGGREAVSLVTSLRGVEDVIGKYQGYFVVKTIAFTPTCKLSYIQMIHAKGPLFAKFLVFNTGTAWVVETVRFHTDPEQIWPSELLSGAHQ